MLRLLLRIQGRRWTDTVALWVNALFWLPRRWYHQWRLGSREAAWRHLMRNPKYHWTRWPLSLSHRKYRYQKGAWVDSAGIVWFIAGYLGDCFPSHWLTSLSHSSTGIDVGAHRGYWSLYNLKAKEKGILLLLEPDPENYALLTENLSANRAYHTIPLRVAAWREPTVLFMESGSAEESLHASFGYRVRKSTDIPSENTPVLATSIDALVRAFALPSVDWIKIDVEGAEVEVLQGAKETLQRFSPTLWIEIHDTWQKVEAFLHDMGYIIREKIPIALSEGPYREGGYLWAEREQTYA